MWINEDFTFRLVLISYFSTIVNSSFHCIAYKFRASLSNFLEEAQGFTIFPLAWTQDQGRPVSD